MAYRRKTKDLIDKLLSIIIIFLIFSTLFYLYKIISSPHSKDKKLGNKAQITIVWKNILPEMVHSIKVGQGVYNGNEPFKSNKYDGVVVDLQTIPHQQVVFTPAGTATVISRKDTIDAYLTIETLQPFYSNWAIFGKDAIRYGNMMTVCTSLWCFHGTVSNIKIFPESQGNTISSPHSANINFKDSTYIIISRSIIDEVLQQIHVGDTIYDIYGNPVFKVVKFFTKPQTLVTVDIKGKAHYLNSPLKKDLYIYLKPIDKGEPCQHITFNHNDFVIGTPHEIRGKTWRIWGRIIDIIPTACGGNEK